MDPLYPGPLDLVSANLRRAYRGTPTDALPQRLATLLSRIAARTAPPTGQPDDAAHKKTKRTSARTDPTQRHAHPAQVHAMARTR